MSLPLSLFRGLCPPQLEALADHPGGGGSSPGAAAAAILAQDVILAVLRGNEALAEACPASLVALFARAVGASPDPSASPGLEFFFTACRPEGRPLPRNQGAVVEALLLSAAAPGQPSGGLCTALRCCLDAAAAAVPQWPAAAEGADGAAAGGRGKGKQPAGKVGKASPGGGGKTGGKTGGKSGSNLGSGGGGGGGVAMADPARLVRLMTAIIEGGNEYTWQQLASRAGVSVERACETVGAFLSPPPLPVHAHASREVLIFSFHLCNHRCCHCHQATTKSHHQTATKPRPNHYHQINTPRAQS